MAGESLGRHEPCLKCEKIVRLVQGSAVAGECPLFSQYCWPQSAPSGAGTLVLDTGPTRLLLSCTSGSGIQRPHPMLGCFGENV